MMVLAAPVFAITVTGVVIDKATNNPVINGTPSGYSADFLRDGQVFILHGGKIYNAFGAEIR